MAPTCRTIGSLSFSRDADATVMPRDCNNRSGGSDPPCPTANQRALPALRRACGLFRVLDTDAPFGVAAELAQAVSEMAHLAERTGRSEPSLATYLGGRGRGIALAATHHIPAQSHIISDGNVA